MAVDDTLVLLREVEVDGSRAVVLGLLRGGALCRDPREMDTA